MRKIENKAVSEASESQFHAFEKFLGDVLVSHSSLGVGAKATRLMLEHERVFVLSEIFSDIRSVFAQDDVEELPVTAIITHSLKIHSHINGGRPDDIFFALDIDDLLQLKEAVDRAIRKHDTLSKMIEKLNIMQFALEDDIV